MSVPVAQLRAWTYERQRLGRAAPDARTALRDIVAAYSSHPSAPLTMHARAARMTREDFRELDVLRLPAMRGSIHLLPRETAHLAFRAVPESPSASRRRLKTFAIEDSYEALRPRVLAAAAQPVTLDELRERSGAGEATKGVSAALTRTGELVRIGADGLRSNALRYVAAEVSQADAEEALKWLVGEYLRAFGPVREADVVWWTGGPKGRVREALAAHDTVDLENGLLLLAADEASFATRGAEPPAGVDLLPKWDAYTMGYAPDGRDRFADPEVVERCYDFRGDGCPVVLVDGAAAGTWSLTGDRFAVELFDGGAQPPPRLAKAIEERADAVRALLVSG